MAAAGLVPHGKSTFLPSLLVLHWCCQCCRLWELEAHTLGGGDRIYRFTDILHRLFDVGKQVVGQMFVHGVNVLVSDLVSRGTDENACVAYFFNVLVDTTLGELFFQVHGEISQFYPSGVALLYMILHILTYLAVERLSLEGFQSGVYGKPPAFVYWTKQTALYVVALTTMKFLVIGLLAIFPGLFVIGAWLLSWTKSGKGDSLQVILFVFPATSGCYRAEVSQCYGHLPNYHEHPPILAH